MELQDIIYSKEGPIATVTLNRPDRLNAFTGQMIFGLVEAIEDARADNDIRVIVITGAGRGFCSGLDMAAQAGGEGIGPGITGGRMRTGGPSLPVLMLSLDKPTIASINGPAIGWGLELAQLCDIRIASDKAVMGDMHVKRGLVPDNGGHWLLPRLIGWAKACEIMFLGERMDATEAARIGLVNVVVPHEELERTTKEWATKIASNAPLAVQMAKRQMRLGLSSNFESNLAFSVFAQGRLFQTEDFREGVRSFAEKRDPVFKGE
jgi:enoyl-CoA hydratase/carnithine racemase